MMDMRRWNIFPLRRLGRVIRPAGHPRLIFRVGKDTFITHAGGDRGEGTASGQRPGLSVAPTPRSGVGTRWPKQAAGKPVWPVIPFIFAASRDARVYRSARKSLERFVRSPV
jgi:hypothetical protein